jgi:hypothetical protein
MVDASERRRLESAYPTPADARAVLRACALVACIAITAAVIGQGDASTVVADVTERPDASDR